MQKSICRYCSAQFVSKGKSRYCSSRCRRYAREHPKPSLGKLRGPEELTPDTVALLCLAYREGDSYKQIASTYNRPLQFVKDTIEGAKGTREFHKLRVLKTREEVNYETV